MFEQLYLRDRFHAIVVLGSRDLSATLLGPGLWLGLSLSLGVSAFVLNSYVGLVERQGAVAVARPLFFPLVFAVITFSLYLGLASSMAVSREKEHGTLEVLFYGPVDHFSYLVAKYVAQMLVYLVAAVVCAVSFFLYSLATGLAYSDSIILGLLLSLAPVSSVVTLSILISVLSARARSSVILFVATVLAFALILVASLVASGLDPETTSLVLQGLLSRLSPIFGVAEWISPFSYLYRGMEALNLGDGAGYLSVMLASAAYAAALLSAAIQALKLRGVRK